ncbi:phosphatidylserine decarboxylase [Geomesophilobacter sediminis]|uniref:Phosphatidylserine decarboxylase n=1 Tax=Geomesophilobacter sediminis TaxID=2798584 RepID=A0A8J7IPR8_9BACT|nr:phosphatidylserine decarboxylase [Geomesophilobacter sediminis]MBJ6724459.1 phosphatidylserine decarboxylase [Geomesophilobacter sediminis]
MRHQYIERSSGSPRTEPLFGDRLVTLLYHRVREHAPALFDMVTSARMTDVLGYLNFDLPFGMRGSASSRFLRELGVDLSECLEPDSLDTPRKVFERRIRYQSCRPMPEDAATVVSPADARVLVGSCRENSALFIKDKFFSFEELLGETLWHEAFRDGDFALFRLTPDKYHYNHVPVSGVVVDLYQIDGAFNSCNPGAIVTVATPYSKNRRVVTVIDTDVKGGTGVGLVAMVEVVALMIGEIVQCYSEHGYENPQPVEPGLFLEKGQPKSLYRPGSSTDILFFQQGRVTFARDLVANQARCDVESRFSRGFRMPLVETDIQVRSQLAERRG